MAKVAAQYLTETLGQYFLYVQGWIKLRKLVRLLYSDKHQIK